jgi:hypothetical protein
LLSRGKDVFTSGGQKYFDRGPDAETKRIFVRITLDGVPHPLLAALDTGSPWSVVNGEIGKTLGLFEREGQETRVQGPYGLLRGKLVRADLTILAEDGMGESLDMQATLFVSDDWPKTFCVLGYGGLIEFIRLGLDAPENYFYFGGT